MSIANAAHCSMMSGGKPPAPPSPAYWGLCFTAEEANVVVNMSATGDVSGAPVSLEYSIDGINWMEFDADTGTTPITLAEVGNKVFFKAGSEGNIRFSSGTQQHRGFTFSGLTGASGNIMSLLDGANEGNTTLSATWTFSRLFYGCTNLTKPPMLPATTLAATCYRQMFYGCTNLSGSIDLPASTIPISAYFCMFVNTQIESIKVGFVTWPSSSSVNGGVYQWVSGVPATGTFYCPAALGTNETILRGVSRCPEGWTVINI